MRLRAPTVLVAVTTLAACATAGGGPSDPASRPLAYTLPPGGTLTYVQGDTAVLEIDVQGQSLQVEVESEATLDMTFEEADGRLRVSTVFTALDGRVSNPMTGTQSVDEGDVDGAVVFSVDSRGEGELISAPELAGDAEQMVTPAGFTAFFPRLPGRAVAPGDRWVDTVYVDTETGGGRLVSRSVVTYDAVVDTVVDGSPALRVSFVSDDESRMEMVQAGMNVIQDVGGESEGWFLWDRARGVMLEQVSEGRLRGTMEVSAAPMPLPVSIDVSQRVRLLPSGG